MIPANMVEVAKSTGEVAISNAIIRIIEAQNRKIASFFVQSGLVEAFDGFAERRSEPAVISEIVSSFSTTGKTVPTGSSSIFESVFGTESKKPRSEEHTSELQSQFHLACRLLLEKILKTLFVGRKHHKVCFFLLDLHTQHSP